MSFEFLNITRRYDGTLMAKDGDNASFGDFSKTNPVLGIGSAQIRIILLVA